jgi:hypothetical protein
MMPLEEVLSYEEFELLDEVVEGPATTIVKVPLLLEV